MPRVIVSISGPAGTGKSQLALAVAGLLGEDIAARLPMDWFIEPRATPMADWLSRPIAYDHEAVREILTAPDGEIRSTPPFDFTTFRHSETSGDRRPVPIRPVMILDAMEPWPGADLSVLVETPVEVRYRRIEERDARWGTTVIDRWGHLELTRRHVASLDHRYDLVLDGEESILANADRVVDALRSRGLLPPA